MGDGGVPHDPLVCVPSEIPPERDRQREIVAEKDQLTSSWRAVMAIQPAEERTTSAALSLQPLPVTDSKQGSSDGNWSSLSGPPNGT